VRLTEAGIPSLVAILAPTVSDCCKVTCCDPYFRKLSLFQVDPLVVRGRETKENPGTIAP
jgi:hypothetical protein